MTAATHRWETEESSGGPRRRATRRARVCERTKGDDRHGSQFERTASQRARARARRARGQAGLGQAARVGLCPTMTPAGSRRRQPGSRAASRGGSGHPATAPAGSPSADLPSPGQVSCPRRAPARRDAARARGAERGGHAGRRERGAGTSEESLFRSARSGVRPRRAPRPRAAGTEGPPGRPRAACHDATRRGRPRRRGRRRRTARDMRSGEHRDAACKDRARPATGVRRARPPRLSTRTEISVPRRAARRGRGEADRRVPPHVERRHARRINTPRRAARPRRRMRRL